MSVSNTICILKNMLSVTCFDSPAAMYWSSFITRIRVCICTIVPYEQDVNRHTKPFELNVPASPKACLIFFVWTYLIGILIMYFTAFQNSYFQWNDLHYVIVIDLNNFASLCRSINMSPFPYTCASLACLLLIFSPQLSSPLNWSLSLRM